MIFFLNAFLFMWKMSLLQCYMFGAESSFVKINNCDSTSPSVKAVCIRTKTKSNMNCAILMLNNIEIVCNTPKI